MGIMKPDSSVSVDPLGWELHCAESDQPRLYSALLEAGKALDIGPVGSRALMSLRVEKGYGSWGRDYSPEYWPQETGLAGLVKLDKPFLNCDTCAEVMARPPREVLRTLVIEADRADATGGEPIFDLDGKPAGKVSSGAYGYHVGQSLALAYLRPDIAAGTALEVMVLGRLHQAVVLQGPAFDPEGNRFRA
jgi:dimethylglycine dehydrogenase